MYLKLFLLNLVLHGIVCANVSDLIRNNGIELNLSNSKSPLVSSFVQAQIAGKKILNADVIQLVFYGKHNDDRPNYVLVKTLLSSETLSHYSIDWLNPLPDQEFCLHTGGDQHWYSTYEEQDQRWPIDKNFTFKESFSVHDQAHNYVGGVLEHLFLRSDGLAFFAERQSPLVLRRDANGGDPVLCFSGDYSRSPYNNAIDKHETKLTFHLVTTPDILQAYRYAANKWFRKPTAIPDQRMIKYPIW